MARRWWTRRFPPGLRLGGQGVVEALVGGLGQRRGHALGGVEPRQRRGAVDARVGAVDEALPADLLQIRELEIGPGLDVLGDPVAVLGRGVGAHALAVGRHDADLAVVEVDLLVRVHQAHVVGPVGVAVGEDHLLVGVVAQDDLVEDAQAELGELDRPAADLLDLGALLLRDALGHAAGHRGGRVDLAAADHLDDVVALLAGLDDLAADFHADLGQDAQDVALGRRGVRSDHEVGAAQGVEVGGVVGHVEGAVEQLAQELGGPRRVDVVDRVGGLRGGHVVRFRADAADAVGQRRHLLHGAADAEPLEAAQLRNLEVRVGDLTVRIEEDLDLAVALEPGDGVDGDPFHAHFSPSVFQAALELRSSEPARLKR